MFIGCFFFVSNKDIMLISENTWLLHIWLTFIGCHLAKCIIYVYINTVKTNSQRRKHNYMRFRHIFPSWIPHCHSIDNVSPKKFQFLLKKNQFSSKSSQIPIQKSSKIKIDFTIYLISWLTICCWLYAIFVGATWFHHTGTSTLFWTLAERLYWKSYRISDSPLNWRSRATSPHRIPNGWFFVRSHRKLWAINSTRKTVPIKWQT